MSTTFYFLGLFFAYFLKKNYDFLREIPPEKDAKRTFFGDFTRIVVLVGHKKTP
jgi:hypothetical protein